MITHHKILSLSSQPSRNMALMNKITVTAVTSVIIVAPIPKHDCSSTQQPSQPSQASQSFQTMIAHLKHAITIVTSVTIASMTLLKRGISSHKSPFRPIRSKSTITNAITTVTSVTNSTFAASLPGGLSCLTNTIHYANLMLVTKGHTIHSSYQKVEVTIRRLARMASPFFYIYHSQRCNCHQF